MKIKLEQLETRLQSLIEGSAARLFALGDRRKDLGCLLVEAMEANIQSRADGLSWAPSLYSLLVHPKQVKDLRDSPGLLDELARLIEQAGQEAGLHFISRPSVQVIGDARVKPDETHVEVAFPPERLVDTTSLLPPSKTNETGAPQGAFLIVENADIFPLESLVVSIGRSPANNLVIDDIRVSRSHAQLRQAGGKFVIFDLDSTGGTYVNGQRVTQCQLFPGDVISLAGVSLVFGQDDPASAGYTQPYHPDMDGSPK